MSADDFDFLIAEVSDILEQLGMLYGIVGSVASLRYGENRATNDVDVLIAFRISQPEAKLNPQNILRLGAAKAPHFWRRNE